MALRPIVMTTRGLYGVLRKGGVMATVSIAEAKDRLPQLIIAAEAGETVTITRHGQPVAHITAAAPAAATVCAPESIDWIEAQLASLPPCLSDPATVLNAMRDDA